MRACTSEGASHIIGDWTDPTGSFYQGSTISITEAGWTVTPGSYAENDLLTLEKIGDAYSLTEHDGTHLDGTILDTAHDVHHMAVLMPDGTLKVTEEHRGHREWHLERTTPAPTIDQLGNGATCIMGATNTGPGHTWVWSDGTDVRPATTAR